MINLSATQLILAFFFIIVLLVIVRNRGIKREREILVSSVRMTIQLYLTGYILIYIFNNTNPVWTIIVITGMETFAVLNIFKRTKRKLSVDLKWVIAISLLTGSLLSLFYFLIVIVNIKPWYDPRYFIPIAGMLIGNSMTGISLGVNKLLNNMELQKAEIECALMLGATPKDSTRQIVDNAFDSAILPTINSMMGMGIVFLPGMMTGQILSGISPITAIEYQIAIMLGILGSVALTVILFVLLGVKTFFNKEKQLK